MAAAIVVDNQGTGGLDRHHKPRRYEVWHNGAGRPAADGGHVLLAVCAELADAQAVAARYPS